MASKGTLEMFWSPRRHFKCLMKEGAPIVRVTRHIMGTVGRATFLDPLACRAKALAKISMSPEHSARRNDKYTEF